MDNEAVRQLVKKKQPPLAERPSNLNSQCDTTVGCRR